MNPTAQPLVSVVTPVYNGERYLAECIESVLAQTYQNWEYVIVNNCSTDRTLEIAQNYAKKDARIRIHDNKEFLSALQNHNHALRLISPESKYCKVVHADDWLFPECIEQMVEVAEANPTVSIVGSYTLNGVRVKCDGLPYPSTVISGREICRATLRQELYVFGSPTSILIHSDLIQKCKAFYNELYLHADTEVCYEVLRNSDFGFVHQVLSYTRLHSESQTEALAKRYNTLALDFLGMVTKYGLIYFNGAEYEEILKKTLKRYYGFLARSILLWRGKQFWNYHKNGLKNMGYSISMVKLISALFLEVLDLLFNPKNTAGRITRVVKRKLEARKKHF